MLFSVPILTVSYAYTLQSTEKKFFVTSLIALVLLSKKADFPGLIFACMLKIFGAFCLKLLPLNEIFAKK